MLATIKFHDLAHYVGDFANSPTCSHVGTSPILLLHMPLKLLMDFCVILFLIIIATLKLPSFSSCFLFFQDLHALLVFDYFFHWECFIFYFCLQIHDILHPRISSSLERLVSQFVGLQIPHVLILIISWDNFQFLRLL